MISLFDLRLLTLFDSGHDVVFEGLPHEGDKRVPKVVGGGRVDEAEGAVINGGVSQGDTPIKGHIIAPAEV